MPHFFISYAKKDTSELALALSDALNALPNMTAWVDRSLTAGDNWELKIQAEINKCDYFVVLYSPDLNRHLVDTSVSESYVLTEIAYAKYTLKKPIIPVMAQSTEPPIALIMMQYIDFAGKNLSFTRLLEDIFHAVEKSTQNNTIAPIGMIPFVPPPTPQIYDILPAPFDWCEIPAGSVTLGAAYTDNAHSIGQSFDLPRFYMAKYPVTNAQFAKFIEAGGYQNSQWWTNAGWGVREQGYTWDAFTNRWKATGKAWIEPQKWQEKQWNRPEQPVVGISWYEALAFCLWLSTVSGEKILLPSEQAWQLSAAGFQQQEYPWGQVFDKTRANTQESNLKKTTPVTNYPSGASPYGVWGMAGNVWEWCLTSYESGAQDINKSNNETRVLRGGSWSHKSSDAATTYRYFAHPAARNSFYGFRISAALS